jgi:multidrug efflux system membrane fusion protein
MPPKKKTTQPKKSEKKSSPPSSSNRSFFHKAKARLSALKNRAKFIPPIKHYASKKFQALLATPAAKKIQKHAKEQNKKMRQSKAFKLYAKQPLPIRASLVTTAVFILWMSTGIVFSSQESQQPEQETPLFQIRFLESVAREETLFIELSGETTDSRHVVIKSELSGRVNIIHHDKGSLVEAGDPLVQIDPVDMEEEAARARAELALQEIEFSSAQNLTNQGLRSRTRLIQAEANYLQAQARFKRVQRDLDNATVRAPFSGVLSAVDVERGDFLSIGTPVATLNDLDPLIVRTSISEQDIDRVSLGDTATITFSNGAKTEGLVSFVARSGNDNTRTFEVEIEIANHDAEIRKGLSAKISISTGTAMAHSLPNSVLSLDDQGRVGVKIVTANDSVRFQAITILQDKFGEIVFTGIGNRARVISVGQEFVSEGQRIIPKPDQRFLNSQDQS